MYNIKFYKLLVTIVFLVTFFANVSISQVSQEWINTYNSPTNGPDNPVAMTVDNSGNVYVTGVSSTSTTGRDIATIKYNSSGVEQWVARYDNGSGDDVKGITVDASGNVYIAASIVVNNSGVQATVKYNSSGVEQWVALLGVPVGSPAGPGNGKSCIATDASGNVYVGGSRIFGSGQNGSYLLTKYNSNGDSVWTRTYKGSHFLAGLGSGIVCIKVDGSYIYVTGKSFDQNPDLSASAFATTIKYDLSGSHQWMRKDTLVNGSDDVIGMDIDASGNIIVICDFGFNLITYKYNSSGAMLWKRIYSGIAGDYYDEVTGLALDASGNIFLTGNSHRSVGDRDFLTLKYDASGNLLWERFYNGSGNDGDYSKGISVDASGNAYITGLTYETNFNFDYTTIRYDADGTQRWKIRYDGGFTNRRDEPVTIETDPDDNVIVTGISSRGVNTDDYATIKYSQSVGINQFSTVIPEGYYLSQNYPNPFNPVTSLEFGISSGERGSGSVSLRIYDILGKEVAVLVNSILQPGLYKFIFNASGFNSGIYFYRLETDNFSAVRKMILQK